VSNDLARPTAKGQHQKTKKRGERVKNGRYVVRVSADGLSEDTTLFLHDARAETIGGGCELRGQISQAGRHI
jgi:hypothetical protein